MHSALKSQLHKTKVHGIKSMTGSDSKTYEYTGSQTRLQSHSSWPQKKGSRLVIKDGKRRTDAGENPARFYLC